MISTQKLVMIVVLVLFFVIGLNRLFFIERWQNYERQPFKRVSTGSNPLGFYQRNTFRKPYMYPQKIYENNPLPNVTYYI